MKRVMQIILILLVATLPLAGCGGGGDDPASTGTLTTSPSSGADSTYSDSDATTSVGPPAALVLTTTLPAGTALSQGGQTSFIATVTDENGNTVADGTVVGFSADAGSITETSITVGGEATATFTAGSSGGLVTVTATVAADVTDALTITVASGAAASISLGSIVPEQIGVLGSGTNEVSTITFKVLDSGGNAVTDGTTVNFSLPTPLGGGESLTATSDTTTDGKVTVGLHSGTVSGVATVAASVTVDADTISTEARVTIISGPPDYDHFSLAADRLNVAGYVTYGLKDQITAYLADQYSNPVVVGTPIAFRSEGGFMVQTDDSGNQTNLTNYSGQAIANMQTADPTPDTVSFEDDNIGGCRILATTQGQESYDDSNGNGYYDSGESFTDIGEPFIDANDNGVHDPGEEYIDGDGNGSYSGPNGVWDGDTIIWTTMVVRWSDRTGSPQLSPSTFFIADGGKETFDFQVEDSNGNPLKAGATFNVETTAGKLSGVTSGEVTDHVYSEAGVTDYRFTLADDNPGDTDKEEDVEITITITAPDNGGGKTVYYQGKID